MSLRKYKRIKYLGKGSYGAAILVNLRANAEKKFVVKEIVIGHLSEEEQAAAKKEADVLHKMQHSNITMYIESFVESSKLYIVMEADGGDAVANRKTEALWQEDEVSASGRSVLLSSTCTTKTFSIATSNHRIFSSQAKELSN